MDRQNRHRQDQPSTSRRMFDCLRCGSWREKKEKKAAEEMSRTIWDLRLKIDKAKEEGNTQLSNDCWKEWLTIQEEGKLDKYITSETKEWQKQETDKFVDLHEKMEEKVKNGNMNENDIKTKLEELKLEYQKKEMLYAVVDLKLYLERKE